MRQFNGLGHSDDDDDRKHQAAQPTENVMDAMHAYFLAQRIAEGEIGLLEDVGKSALICDVCDVVAWEGGTEGQPCPNCVEKWEASNAVRFRP